MLQLAESANTDSERLQGPRKSYVRKGKCAEHMFSLVFISPALVLLDMVGKEIDYFAVHGPCDIEQADQVCIYSTAQFFDVFKTLSID